MAAPVDGLARTSGPQDQPRRAASSLRSEGGGPTLSRTRSIKQQQFSNTAKRNYRDYSRS